MSRAIQGFLSHNRLRFLSKIGALIAPESLTLTTAPLLGVKLVRTGVTLSNTTINNRFQDYSNNGYETILTVNSHPLTNQPFMDPTLWQTKLTTWMDTALAGYNVKVLCIENEENNQGYHEGLYTDYLALLNIAITEGHSRGYKVTNGGMTGPALKWMCWKDILDNQGSTAATTFANKVFNSGQIAGLPNFPTQPAYQLPIEFLQGCIPAYASNNMDYVNFHFYEPSHSDIIDNTVIDPTAIVDIANYLKRVTGKKVITNECGQHNGTPGIVTQLLTALTNYNMEYICWYSGDGDDEGGAVALQDVTTGALRDKGIVFRDYLINYI